jgi:hypothetical protein
MFGVIGYRQPGTECEFARHAVKAYTETKTLTVHTGIMNRLVAS